jgi:hypothetical protein
VYVAGTAKQEIRVRSGRDDEGKVGIARFRLQATDTTGAMATASQTVATSAIGPAKEIEFPVRRMAARIFATLQVRQ